jgi:hypothetical protein
VDVTYGVIVTVTGPVESYDALHRELLKVTDPTSVEGLLVHVGRSVAGGFQVLEVWESKDQFDRYNRDVVWPLAAKVLADTPAPTEPVTEEFEVRGLVLPGHRVAT